MFVSSTSDQPLLQQERLQVDPGNHILGVRRGPAHVARAGSRGRIQCLPVVLVQVAAPHVVERRGVLTH